MSKKKKNEKKMINTDDKRITGRKGAFNSENEEGMERTTTGAKPGMFVNNDEVRMVLVGKSGAGKSAAGNTLLGREAFHSEFCATSLTMKCAKVKGEVDGQEIVVVDTPGIFDTRFPPEETDEEIKKCITYSSPGPHIFLVVIRLGRFTDEEKKTVENIQKVFGEEAAKYTMILFTHGDQLETTLERFLQGSDDLQDLVSKCKGQYHLFKNKDKDPSQVTELLEKINKMVERNGGNHYTNEMFQGAQRAIEEEKQRIQREKEEKRQKKAEELNQKLEEKVRMIREEDEKRNELERKARDEEMRKKLEMTQKEFAQKEEERRREKKKLKEQMEEEKKNAREREDRMEERREKEQNKAWERFNKISEDDRRRYDLEKQIRNNEMAKKEKEFKEEKEREIAKIEEKHEKERQRAENREDKKEAQYIEAREDLKQDRLAREKILQGEKDRCNVM